MLLTTTTQLIFHRLLLATLGLLMALSTWAQTIYVTPDGAGQQSGADWTNALSGNQLQARLTSATSGTVFRLAGGVYKPTTTGDRFVSFIIPPGVALYGGYAGSGADPDARLDGGVAGQLSSTTLSGDIDNDDQLNAANTNNVVVFKSDSRISYYNTSNLVSYTTTTILDGLVITGGYASEAKYGVIGGGGMLNYGGYKQGSSPLLRNCVFRQNASTSAGGAVYNQGLAAFVEPTFINCEFSNNTAPEGGAMFNAGFFCQASPHLTNCRFINNSAQRGGCLYNIARGGPYTNLEATAQANPVLINCSFAGNTASEKAGVMYTRLLGPKSSATRPELVNCTLSGNTAPLGGAFYNDGTIMYDVIGGTDKSYELFSGPTLSNCILWNNGGPMPL
jgi:hypothetical protein